MIAGYAKLALCAYEEAVVQLRRSVEANRKYGLTHFGLAAALVYVDRLDEARAHVKTGLAPAPAFTISRFRAGIERKSNLFGSARTHLGGHAQGRGAGWMSTLKQQARRATP